MRRVVTAAFLLAFLGSSSAFSQAKSGNSGVYEQLNLFGEAFERIRQDAVEAVSDKTLIDTAIAGMLSSLDAHSVYLSEAAYQALQSPGTAQPASIGLVVTIDKGMLKVISPRDGSPAAKAGVAPGDVIFTIDKEPTYELTLSEIEQKLTGPAGSKVELTLRRGTGDPMTLTIARAVGKLPTVTDHVEGGDIGYLRIAGFDGDTQAAIASAVQDVRRQAGNRLVGYVLDLRNNPGGNFDAAVAAADDFLDKGDIVVVKGRGADSTKRIAATPGDLAGGLPVVALVNGGTAREAELVAGALQDNHRAVLLGSKTFGEASIETLIPVPGAGAIRLTTARFTTPSGRAIQGKGLDPDLRVTPVKLERLAEGERRHEADLRGALKNTDPVNPDVASPAGTPPAGASAAAQPAPVSAVATGDIGTSGDEQLAQAVDVLHGLALVRAAAH